MRRRFCATADEIVCQKMKHRLLVFLWAIVLCAAPLYAQDAGITTTLDRAEIMIGEQAVITMKIRTDRLDETYLIIPQKEQLGKAEALSFAVTDTVDLPGSVKEITAQMVVTSFAEDEIVELPAFGVKVGGKEMFSRPLVLKVMMPDVDTTQAEQFYPLKGPWHLKYSFAEIMALLWPWLLGLLLVAGGILGYRIVRKRKARAALQPSRKVKMVPLTPLQQLRAEMEALQAQHLPEQGKVREFFTLADGSFRTYLTRLGVMDASKATSRQLYATMRQKGLIPDDAMELMKRLLDSSDRAKFSAASLPATDAQTAGDKYIGVAIRLDAALEQKEEEDAQ